MIFELFFILDLLKRNELVTQSTPTQVQEVVTAVRQTKGSTSNLGGSGLFKVGPITEIRVPVDISPYTLEQANADFNEAIKGIPITSLPYLGKR
jgi:hypothetical protein